VFHSSVAEDCFLLGCDTASVGIWILTSKENIVALSQGFKCSRTILQCFVPWRWGHYTIL